MMLVSGGDVTSSGGDNGSVGDGSGGSIRGSGGGRRRSGGSRVYTWCESRLQKSNVNILEEVRLCSGY